MLVPTGPIRAGLLSLIVAVSLALLAGSAASASAALLVMEKPTNGTITKVTTPTFSGTAVDLEDPVTVVIHEGSSLSGPALPPLSTPVSEEGTWSVTAEALAEGTYTAEAEQTEMAGMGQTNTAGPVTFTIDTKPPTVTLKQPLSPSNNTTPTFEGTASESSTVTIDIYAGSKAGGKVVASATAEGNGGEWTSKKASPALSDGEYTAVATQESSLGNGPGESFPVHFEVDTESPVVTLKQPTTPSKDTTPSFSGTASADTEVVIHIYEGSKEVATAEAPGTGGNWSSDAVALKSGYHEYTAVATQESPLGNPEGKSDPRTFIVDTEAPGVKLDQPTSPSKDTEPSFSGTATGEAEVVVHIYAGSKVEGEPVATATAPPPGAGNSWSSGQASPALETGRHTYTAVATQQSLLGNPEGVSEARTFEVDTEAPKVTLNAPAKLSDETKPSFSGSASEATEVVVYVYEGTKAGGTLAASAKTTASGGSWSTTGAELSKALSTGKHTYTAVAKEQSGLGNEEGRSEERTFEVNTNPPTVTLAKVASPTNDTTPAFSGSASEATGVVVQVYEGAKAEGALAATATTTASGGSWSTTSSELSNALPPGKHTFTAVAIEVSGLGNEEGRSEERTFEVDTDPPVVTLTQPETPTRETRPSFSGTASEDTEVVVHVFEGSTEVAKAKTTASGGAWSTSGSELSEELSEGKGTFTVYATEQSGLGNTEGKSSTLSFEVDTEAPTVTLAEVPSPTNNQRPSFSGTASEDTEVVVHVFEGSTEVAKAKTMASGGTWSTSGSELSKELSEDKHTFTAYAIEKSGLGNGEGTSAPRTFEVNTEAPKVTMAKVPSPTNDRTPSFSGTATEDTEVVVHVFAGSKGEGEEVASAKTTASGGSWATTGAELSKALSEGKNTFSAYATEVSGLGNKAGKSSVVVFEVNTKPPDVVLNQPTTPSNDVKPVFTGTASEAGPAVTVDIYEGKKAEGVIVATATAVGGRGGESWTSAGATPELKPGDHTFTAVAVEPSGLGNAEGHSEERTFVVDTLSPTVTLNSPVLRSNDTTPSFSGTASEAGTVTVELEGKTAKGKTVKESLTVSVTAKEGGAWETKHVSPALEEGKYTVVATEPSGLGNGSGSSGKPLEFEVVTEPPTVTLNTPTTPSKETRPSFGGTASEDTEVVVHVFAGSKGEGEEVASAKTTASGGSWATTGAELSKALSEGKNTFSAYATEVSGLGNKAGKSSVVVFEVNTKPPDVVLSQPTTPSNDVKPVFTGTASEAGPTVTVDIYEGKKAEGVIVATATAAGGRESESWTSTSATPELKPGEHTFTAVAVESSGLGNAEGHSEERTFVVDTEAPKVTLNAPAKLRSNDTTPSFSGTTTEAGTVTVALEGKTATGKTVKESLTVSVTAKEGGAWETKHVSPALEEGKYTVVATEPSGLGNGAGSSGKPLEFEVVTEPPTVTLNTPTTPSKETRPSFGGTASEDTEVVVHVFAGSKGEGEEVASAKTTASGGSWATTGAELSKALSEGNNKFSAYATEVSGLGNKAGKSSVVIFEVNTKPPVVALSQPTSPSNNVKPVFTGTASEAGPAVTVDIYEGKKAEGAVVATATAAGGRGGESWTSAGATPELKSGDRTFTAVAVEPSGLGNAEGHSEERTFVVDTEAPKVTLNAPAKLRSNDTTPSFSGTASETAPAVTVDIYAGTEAKGTVVASATAAGARTGEDWSSGDASPALSNGTFTAVAVEPSGIGNAEGKSAPVTFEVDTLPPTVTLEPLALISNDTKPSFSGTASESMPVTVEVFEGAKAEGKPVAKLVAPVSGGDWSSARTTELANGQYTAIASEPSSLENAAGYSKSVTFEVDTEAPTVTLRSPASPSNDTEPSFSGEVSGPAGKPVTVYVYEGSTPEGKTVREVKATIVDGAWKSAALTPALPSGKHTFTAVATAPSSIGNVEGKSAPATFVVDTEPPTVTLNQLPSLSNDATPSFSGTASETTSVVVSIYRGATAQGSAVATTTVPGTGGSWASQPLSPALEDGQYTAIATQQSGIGNGSGGSEPVSFTIDTKPPTVTLNGIPSPSSDRVPSFSGTATDDTPVTVVIHQGASATGPEVLSMEARVTEGEWYSGAVSSESRLEWGEYTAVATEPSSIGNPQGASSPVTFVVAQIPPSVLTETASSVTRTSAALYGSVNPLGGPVSACDFEVGTSTSYGRTVGCGFVSGALAFPPTEVGFVPVFIRIYGLEPSTTYHYRVVATGEGGSEDGTDETFTTLEPLSFAEPQHAASPPSSSGSGHPAAGGVAAFFAEQLKPAGKAARIGAILKNGSFKERFKAPEAGTAAIKWYYLPRGAKLASSSKHAGKAASGAKHGKAAPAPVLVAAGSVTFHAAGTSTLELRLTRAGRRLLEHSKRVRLTATCAFKPVAGAAVTTSGTFQLER